MASFGRDNFNSVLVADDWVLTAASIFRNNYNPLMWSALVVAGNAFGSGNQDTIHVQDIFLYGGYKEDSNRNDIALVKLQREEGFMPDLNMQTQTKFPPVHLPVPGQLNEDKTCYLIGWKGSDIGVSIPRDLQTTPVTLLNSTRCDEMFGPDSAAPGQLCMASDNLEDGPCQGDQGSPVLCQYGNSWTVVGLVSDLFGCGAEGDISIGTFTDVSHYLPWVKKIMTKF